jgi:hypothetical protein
MRYHAVWAIRTVADDDDGDDYDYEDYDDD